MMDRGALSQLNFSRCERGFILTDGGQGMGFLHRIWAFDRIEDLAGWLVEQYSAQAIEAGTDETERLGPQGESAVATPCAMKGTEA